MGMSEQESAVVVGVGASQGLGAALCRRFAAGGLHVLIGGRTAENLERVAAEIASAGGSAEPFVMDCSQEPAVAAMMAASEAAGRTLRLAAFNAGGNLRVPTLEIEARLLERMWQVNTLGGFLVGREAAKRMLPRARGTILFTGATASIKARPPFLAFAAAKHGLRAVAAAMARDFGPQGVHVGHVIIDGAIDGERVRTNLPDFAASKGDDGLLNIADIADAFWHLHTQPRSAWTFELDLRPFKEPF